MRSQSNCKKGCFLSSTMSRREYKSRGFFTNARRVRVMVGPATLPSIVNEACHEAVHFSGGLNFYDSTARRWRMHRLKKSCLATRPGVLALSFAWKIGAMYPKSRRHQRRARSVSPWPFWTGPSDNKTGFARAHSFIEDSLLVPSCYLNVNSTLSVWTCNEYI